MEQLPWMKPDFDLRKVITADTTGAFQDSLVQALEDLANRLELHRSTCRDAALRGRIDGLLQACETGRDVVVAAYDAARLA